MKTNLYLSNRLKEVLTEGQWVLGTNFKKEIDALDWKMSILVVDNLNTIADLTFHVHYYIAGICRVLEGGPLDIRDKYSFDAPPIKSDADWMSLKTIFAKDAERLISLVECLSEKELSEAFVEVKYGTLQRNIDALIEHTYYHLGQVLLIKKQLNSAQ